MSSRNGGISTKSAGNAMNRLIRASTTVPAKMSITPAANSTGIDSRTTRRTMGRWESRPLMVATRHTAATAVPRISVR